MIITTRSSFPVLKFSHFPCFWGVCENALRCDGDCCEADAPLPPTPLLTRLFSTVTVFTAFAVQWPVNSPVTATQLLYLSKHAPPLTISSTLLPPIHHQKPSSPPPITPSLHHSTTAPHYSTSTPSSSLTVVPWFPSPSPASGHQPISCLPI